MPSRRKKTIDPLELKAGDYVVHEQHGVGRYIELVKRDFGGAVREYLVIEYASSKRGQPGDRIYVPTDGLEQVTRYVGGEAPAVHRIGGSDWIKAKSRARKAVKEIAGELIRLYAARTSAPGFAFSADTPWQRELEDAFAYVETPDQLSTIDEVKRDMERPYPMDRIVCGDVGYGKTEIAVRAAFKAVQDGKQVAVLVPTTLLVQQHLATFTDRYTGFPIKVAGLSRFNSAKENKEILDGLAHGSIDIVIGTHRLLSQDVVIRDLGLVVVDEEQRFGVEHKESLKKMRTSVDVLSMSATPIPRTLEMAITGIREMSTITTPPEERHPVLTYVGPQDDKQVTAAIHRELLRDGQVFYIHNRVESIDIAAAKLRTLVPEARIAIAHGQMNETALEEVILAFWNREFDILVCTTIIENGIDVANANTLLVERADLFGLSQLHQIRGRVGRSRERAYAYFLYPVDKPLTELALDRLTTISTHTDLGSGMQVALKDLEIRGAGNLLGGEQSGHIADVGFDLYMRMVGEAVNEYKTGYFDETPRLKECRVELPVTAHLPHDYIPGERLRLDIYRRLADAQQQSDIDAIREEMVDRFGEPTSVVNVLLQVAALRVMAKNLGITEVILQGNFLRIGEVLLPESTQLRMQRLYPGTLIKNAIKIILIARPKSPLNLPSGRSSIADSPESEEIRNTELLTWAMQAITSTK
ncbi:MAG: transcription-repair coupling factor [Actinobacteria bacterium]|nr:transcription-repair coupling factor [Actinomycetota bacterium]